MIGYNNLSKKLAEIKSLYSDVIFNLDEIESFVDKENLNSRKYIKYLPILDECQDYIEDIISKEHIKGFLNRILSSNDEEVKNLRIYIKSKENIFVQLKACTKCKCFKCDDNCKIEACDRCEIGGKIDFCDNDKVIVYTFLNRTLQFRNNKTDEINTYNVLGIVQDLEYDQLFKIIEFNKQKYVLYFYPKLSGDSYGEIKNAEDFNFAVKAFDDTYVYEVR